MFLSSWMSNRRSTDLTLKKVPNWFPNLLHHFTFPPDMYQALCGFASLRTLGVVNFRHSNKYAVVSLCGLMWSNDE